MAGFSEVVRSLMSERGVSVRGLAAQVRYDQGGLSKVIAGRRRCPPNLARLIGYRTRDTPSSPLLADIAADLAELRLAICRHRSASALPRLARTAAHMSGLVCLTLIKAGEHQSWRRWGRTARHAAVESADLSALAWATAQEAYGYYYAGDMPGAVACSRSALGVSSSPSVGAVLAAALEMRATPLWATPRPR
jgi:hypothetical protein